jgi:methionyl aminopeptidase
MSIESEHDLRALRRVGRVVGLTLRSLEAQVRPGVTTAELDALCAVELEAHGARSAPRDVYGFPGSICISVNDEAVHGVPGKRVIRAGDLVKLDLVAEMDGYFADAAITVPVPPTPPRNRSLVRCARRALGRALRLASSGRLIRELGGAIESEVRRAGFSVLRELAGHGVGRAIHEQPVIPNFMVPDDRRRLTEGLVIAVEPIIGAGAEDVVAADDGWTYRTTDASNVAHFEQTIVVTRGLPVVLTTL